MIGGNSVNPSEIYQRNQVTTARPEELTLMLYNGGIKFLQQAKAAIDKKDIAKAHSHITRVQDIVTELMVTLNMDYEISKTILPLYEYMKRRLIEANMAKDSEILNEIEGMFQELRTTWAQAMKQAKSV
ncbi:flagellar export chaperone FliS [Neobacillus piezotolerans]|uniref:Flagellar secretion chaperone FliS n=1 Tax=Neobacillus piezotolerans TaxID=2259171 RepID=A0A3D8GNZ9_9BACI|nr:flagellar export chaperone FliS [Neobacillus piezotolerans]